MKKTLWRGLGLAVLGALMAITAVPAPAATAAEPLSVEIVIDCQFSFSDIWWPTEWGFERGRFLLIGDVADRGKVMYFSAYSGACTLQGKQGTLGLAINPATFDWTVGVGTGAYAGVTGGGTGTCTVVRRNRTYRLIGYLQP